jgi:hypothetical protein
MEQEKPYLATNKFVHAKARRTRRRIRTRERRGGGKIVTVTVFQTPSPSAAGDLKKGAVTVTAPFSRVAQKLRETTLLTLPFCFFYLFLLFLQ